MSTQPHDGRIDPGSLYKRSDVSVPTGLPLLLICEGWIEAADAASTLLKAILAQSSPTRVATFRGDVLFDQRARRPVMTILDGLMVGMDWPELVLDMGIDANGQPFLLLHGPEPDFSWRSFAEAVATLAASLEVTTMFTVGAYPAPAPHTRPLRVSTTASTKELLEGRQFNTGSLVVPTGVHAAITEPLSTYGIPTIGLWAQVPYYISTLSFPHAAVALGEHLAMVSDMTFDLSPLRAGFDAAQDAIANTITESSALDDLIGDLELRYDEMERMDNSELPSGDELEASFQQYLRNIDGE